MTIATNLQTARQAAAELGQLALQLYALASG